LIVFNNFAIFLPKTKNMAKMHHLTLLEGRMEGKVRGVTVINLEILFMRLCGEAGIENFDSNPIGSRRKRLLRGSMAANELIN